MLPVSSPIRTASAAAAQAVAFPAEPGESAGERQRPAQRVGFRPESPQREGPVDVAGRFGEAAGEEQEAGAGVDRARQRAISSILDAAVGVVGADGQVAFDPGEPLGQRSQMDQRLGRSEPAGGLKVAVAGLVGDLGALEVAVQSAPQVARPELVRSGHGDHQGEQLGIAQPFRPAPGFGVQPFRLIGGDAGSGPELAQLGAGPDPDVQALIGLRAHRRAGRWRLASDAALRRGRCVAPISRLRSSSGPPRRAAPPVPSARRSRRPAHRARCSSFASVSATAVCSCARRPASSES